MTRASRVIHFVFFTVFLDLIGFGIVIPLFPFYVKSMGGSARTLGFLLASFSFTQLVATPLLGRLSDRVGRRRVILLSLAGNAASMVLFALATKVSLLPLLFASRVLAGATAGNLSACQAAIADVTEGEERAKGMGRLGAGIGLGLVLGPALGASLSRFGMWAPPLGAAGMAAGRSRSPRSSSCPRRTDRGAPRATAPRPRRRLRAPLPSSPSFRRSASSSSSSSTSARSST